MAVVVEAAHPDDLDGVLALLRRARLPEAGLRDHLDTLFVARIDGELAGCAALELYGPSALLRSVAVDERRRGKGVGRCLTNAALLFARAHGVQAIYLLTETAPGFFAGLGFSPVDRAAVPAAVRGSVEFASACPKSALAMTRALA